LGFTSASELRVPLSPWSPLDGENIPTGRGLDPQITYFADVQTESQRGGEGSCLGLLRRHVAVWGLSQYGADS
jgi:hypothetical protein